MSTKSKHKTSTTRGEPRFQRNVWSIHLDYAELAHQVSERLGRTYSRQYLYDVLHGHASSKRVLACAQKVLEHHPKPVII